MVTRQNVAGMVHLDRNIDTGRTDKFDRDLLALFWESIGAVLDQLLSQDEINAAESSEGTESPSRTGSKH